MPLTLKGAVERELKWIMEGERPSIIGEYKDEGSYHVFVSLYAPRNPIIKRLQEHGFVAADEYVINDPKDGFARGFAVYIKNAGRFVVGVKVNLGHFVYVEVFARKKKKNNN